jgi:hypothetical protein
MDIFRNIREDGVVLVLNAAERNLLFPSDGTLVEQLDDNSLWAWNASSQTWVAINGGGGGGTYTGASPTTITVGGLPAGSGISGQTYTQIFQSILVPYVSPTFSSFNISGQTNPIEVGTTISGVQSFVFGFTNIGNVQANTLTIRDITAATNLVTGAPITSPQSANVGSILNNSPATHSWQGIATNTNSVVFNSASYTVSWLFRRFSGTSTNTTLTGAQVLALANSQLNANILQTTTFAPGGYKYFVWSDTFAPPTASTGFKDTSNNLPVSMAGSAEGFTSVDANGWHYTTISITSNGVTYPCKMYRTLNQLGSTVTVQVS